MPRPKLVPACPKLCTGHVLYVHEIILFVCRGVSLQVARQVRGVEPLRHIQLEVDIREGPQRTSSAPYIPPPASAAPPPKTMTLTIAHTAPKQLTLTIAHKAVCVHCLGPGNNCPGTISRNYGSQSRVGWPESSHVTRSNYTGLGEADIRPWKQIYGSRRRYMGLGKVDLWPWK